MDFNTDFLDDVEDTSDRSTDFLDDIEDSGDEDSKSPEYSPDIYYKNCDGDGHDTEPLSDVEDESVHLCVTSPPYNVQWDYGSHGDDMAYHSDYLNLLARVFGQMSQKLVPGGRLVINVPTLVRMGAKGGRPLAADIIGMLTARTVSNPQRKGQGSGLQLARHESNSITHPLSDGAPVYALREYIIWNKGFNTDGLAPNGSFPKPWGILLNNMHEAVLVFQRPGDRDVSSIPDEVKEASEIDKEQDDLCDDVWNISPENWDFQEEEESVPVFPEEIPRRAIKLWTYKGDTVLDPFGGRGTTCKVAKEMERHSIMYEKRESLKDEIEDYIGKDQSTLTQW